MESIFCYRNPDASNSAGSGSLQGMKVALQPTLSVAGWPTEAGSQALSGFHALEDAAVVKRLRAAGADLVGFTRVSEFGFGLKENEAGKALQQEQTDVELVLDLTGEARLVAALAKSCGFKPSYGLIPRPGIIGLMPSMETCGILARKVKTIGTVLAAIAGHDEGDFSLPAESLPDLAVAETDPRQTSIGVIAEVLQELPSDMLANLIEELDGLKKMGFSVRELSCPDFAHNRLVHRIVGSVEASSCAGRYDSVRYGKRVAGAKTWNEMYLQSRGAAFGTLLKSYLIQGAFFQFERYPIYEKACRLRARFLKKMEKLTTQADFLLLPTLAASSPGESATLEECYAQAAHTLCANVSGQPALHLPPIFAGQGSSGFQLTGPRRSDGRLLALGDFLLNQRRKGE